MAVAAAGILCITGCFARAVSTRITKPVTQLVDVVRSLNRVDFSRGVRSPCIFSWVMTSTLFSAVAVTPAAQQVMYITSYLSRSVQQFARLNHFWILTTSQYILSGFCVRIRRRAYSGLYPRLTAQLRLESLTVCYPDLRHLSTLFPLLSTVPSTKNAACHLHDIRILIL